MAPNYYTTFPNEVDLIKGSVDTVVCVCVCVCACVVARVCVC